MTGPWLKSALKHDGNHNGLSEADHTKATKAQAEARSQHTADTERAELEAAQKANEKKITHMHKDPSPSTQEELKILMAERVRVARLLQKGGKWELGSE